MGSLNLGASVLYDQMGNVERLQRCFHFGEDVWEMYAGILVIPLARIGPSYIEGAFWSLFRAFENQKTYYLQMIPLCHNATLFS